MLEEPCLVGDDLAAYISLFFKFALKVTCLKFLSENRIRSQELFLPKILIGNFFDGLVNRIRSHRLACLVKGTKTANPPLDGGTLLCESYKIAFELVGFPPAFLKKPRESYKISLPHVTQVTHVTQATLSHMSHLSHMPLRF